MKRWMIAGGLIAATVVVAALALRMWIGIGPVGMSWFGILAMLGGALIALALGFGLMALTFYSNRSGHDDDASR